MCRGCLSQHGVQTRTLLVSTSQKISSVAHVCKLRQSNLDEAGLVWVHLVNSSSPSLAGNAEEVLVEQFQLHLLSRKHNQKRKHCPLQPPRKVFPRGPLQNGLFSLTEKILSTHRSLRRNFKERSLMKRFTRDGRFGDMPQRTTKSRTRMSCRLGRSCQATARSSRWSRCR